MDIAWHKPAFRGLWDIPLGTRVITHARTRRVLADDEALEAAMKTSRPSDSEPPISPPPPPLPPSVPTSSARFNARRRSPPRRLRFHSSRCSASRRGVTWAARNRQAIFVVAVGGDEPEEHATIGALLLLLLADAFPDAKDDASPAPKFIPRLVP